MAVRTNAPTPPRPRPPADAKDALVGVTIGVGPYYGALARVAAACLEKHTGLSSVILSDSHFLESGLVHPAALKLRLFDLVGASSVLYYDADWFCVGPWEPRHFASHPRLVACHDFVLASDWPAHDYNFESEATACRTSGQPFVGEPSGPLRQQYVADVVGATGLRLPPRRWINTGMFIASRFHNRCWLERAEYWYRQPGGHHAKYFEQPAMLRALDELKMTVDYLPRAQNVLVTRMGRWLHPLVGLHVKMSRHEEFVDLIRALRGRQLTPEAIEAAFLDSRVRSSICPKSCRP
jgi:hypothetical protein